MTTDTFSNSTVNAESTVWYRFAPKGSMCMSCAHKKRICSELDFASMQPMIRHGRVTIVKCTDHTPLEK